MSTEPTPPVISPTILKALEAARDALSGQKHLSVEASAIAMKLIDAALAVVREQEGDQS